MRNHEVVNVESVAIIGNYRVLEAFSAQKWVKPGAPTVNAFPLPSRR